MTPTYPDDSARSKVERDLVLARQKAQEPFAAGVHAVFNPEPCSEPEPLDEASIAALLQAGKTTEAAVARLRASHQEAELRYSEYLLSKKWPNPCTPAELAYLARAATAQLRKDGYIR